MASKLGKGWTMARWRELCDLKNLLDDVAQLNTGNRHLERTARCILAAKRLNWSLKRRSLMRFLEELAVVKVNDAAAP